MGQINDIETAILDSFERIESNLKTVTILVEDSPESLKCLTPERLRAIKVVVNDILNIVLGKTWVHKTEKVDAN